MVQIANAWAVNRITGEEHDVAARDVDPHSKEYDWLCPDQCCRIPLTAYSQHVRTFHDPFNEQTFQATVAAHFQRKAHGPDHAPACSAVDDFTKYKLYAREQRAVSHGEDRAFVFNLNIPSSDRSAPTRKRASAVTRHFQEKASSEVAGADQIFVAAEHRPKPHSMGLSSVDKLAKLLDLTAFDLKYRESTLLREGPRIHTLSQLYKDDVVRFYREAHARAKDGTDPVPALIHFKPIALAKFHSKRDLTIQGLAAPVLSSNGRDRYAVSVLLHCATPEIYASLKAGIKSGERSFLVYVPSPYVDLMELAQKKRDMADGRQKDNAVFVHARVGHSGQVMAWSPPSAQMAFHFPDLPAAARNAIQDRGRHAGL